MIRCVIKPFSDNTVLKLSIQIVLLFFYFISPRYFLILLYVCFCTFLSSGQIVFFQKIEYAIFLYLWFYFKILVSRNKLFCSIIYDFILILYLSFAVGVSLLISNMKFFPIFCFNFLNFNFWTFRDFLARFCSFSFSLGLLLFL